MSKTLIDLVGWVDHINARSSPTMKRNQQALADTINRTASTLSGPTAMSLTLPIRLPITTKRGATSARHFIGGEELTLKQAVVTQRTYKLVLEFELKAVSDIDVIRIPLTQALEIVSGLEIRMMATKILMAAENISVGITEKNQAVETEKLGSQYESIGYGSW